ncbi:MAG: radical SAM protein [Methanoregulaceae archaeon]|nr:radical SAM protein [Methanoregulaceae archaeon]MCU0629431.1 radical SAM protein [Methanoregulaceae archaeon]
MDWPGLKAHLLALGTTRLSGEPAGPYRSSSTAGPGAGTGGSVFFSCGMGRVRLAIDPKSPLEIIHCGAGRAILKDGGDEIRGTLEPVALHCPRQAYITVTSGCIFRCRYCEVPAITAGRKTPEEIESMVEAVKGRIDSIALTSGVLESIEEEEEYVLSVVKRLQRFDLPLGVSIFPTEHTAERLHAIGVAEVKFNVEAATRDLFSTMCPGLSYDAVWNALERSVELFGRDHVFSNLIIGLGESDEEAESCISALCAIGVIPVLRPLNPAGALAGYTRPPAERLLRLFAFHTDALSARGLNPSRARTMCVECTGCDLVPLRDAYL